MAKSNIYTHFLKPKKKRKGVHSKNTSKNQRKKIYKGQGK